MAYNLTNFTTSNNMLGMYEAVNSASGNVLSYLFIVSIFFIVLMTLLKFENPPQESFAAASTVLSVISLLFLLAGMINIVWVIGCTILWAASLISLSRS